MVKNTCHPTSNKPDYLLRGSIFFVVLLYLHYAFFEETTAFTSWYNILAFSVFDLMNTIWWGIAVGLIMLSVLSKIPREFVISILGTGTGIRSNHAG